MKKSSGLAQQVLKAQQSLNSWPDALKTSLRLEATDAGNAKNAVDVRYEESLEPKRAKK